MENQSPVATSHESHPSPALIMQTLQGFQQSAALKAAIDLGLFTAIADGSSTSEQIAAACSASTKGTRILCDYLSIAGFLIKSGSTYALTRDSAIFLNINSPAYMGSIAKFLLLPDIKKPYEDLAAVIRKGGTTLPDEGTVTDDNPVWVEFARSMVPMMKVTSELLAGLINGDTARPLRILDIAAGHGIFGIAFAKKFPNAQVTALDWAPVLAVAKENAVAFGVDDRVTLHPGSAFDISFDGEYDIILLTNFLHHFSPEKNIELLKKVRASLKDGGIAVTLEFIPNEDRISPPMTAGFALTMLGSTPEGDAYTFSELESMFQMSGFSSSEFHPLPPTPQQAVISYK